MVAATTVAEPLLIPLRPSRATPTALPVPGNTLEIQGGVPLCGTLHISGAKNEVLPCLAATLLSAEPVTLHNVPPLLDVEVMLAILESLGATVERLGEGTVRVTSGERVGSVVPGALGSRLRASLLLAGPLLGRTGEAVLPLPGGDAIGKRRLDAHILGLEALGTVTRLEENGLRMLAPSLVGADVFLDEPSVTGTENVLMAAVLANGRTVLSNAAAEPHVAGLARMLVGMGAHIGGVGSSTLVVDGVGALHSAEHTVGPDLLEAGSWAAAAVITRGDLTLHGVRAEEAPVLLRVLRRLGAMAEHQGNTLRVAAPGVPHVVPDMMGGIPKVDDGPWPQFPTDLMSVMLTAATQCEGPVLFFEKMYDGRMAFTEQLAGMGARLFPCDPHRVLVCGASPLKAARLHATDVRAGMSMVLAALGAEGTSTVSDMHHVDRGYAMLEDKLSRVGARVRRVR